MPIAVTDANFEKEVLQSDLPVVVDFWAPWCGPCKAMHSVVEGAASTMEGKAKIVKLNVDENGETAGAYSVMSIPTFIVFKGGQPVRTFVGARSKEDFVKEIEAALAA